MDNPTSTEEIPQKKEPTDSRNRPRPAPAARPPPSGYKTQLCRFFQRSTCRYNREECPFAHGDEDLLEPEPGAVVSKPHTEETWQPPAPSQPPAGGGRKAANTQRATRGAPGNQAPPQPAQPQPASQPVPEPQPAAPEEGARGKRAERSAARRGGRRGSLESKPREEQPRQPVAQPAVPPRREQPSNQAAPTQPPRPSTAQPPEQRREPNRGRVVNPNGDVPHAFGNESSPCRHYSKGCLFVATKGDMGQHLRECPFELCKDIIKSGAVDPLLKYFRKQIAEREKLIEQLQAQLANTCTEDEEQEGMLPEQVNHFKQLVHDGASCMHTTTVFSERWPDSDWSCFTHHVCDSDLSYVYDGYFQWVWKGLRHILVRLEKGPA